MSQPFLTRKRQETISFMNKQGSACIAWEKAFVAQSRDAAIGKLFKGIIHNMNGDIQALSMQSELFVMIFEQVDATLARIINSCEQGETRKELETLADLLRRRSNLLPQMQVAVGSVRETIRRATAFGESIGGSDKDDSNLNEVIRSEVKLLCADSFYKHKVKRELVLADVLPPASRGNFVLRYVVFVLLSNALDALKKKPEPPWTLLVETRRLGDQLEIVVQDNGIGIASEDQGHIFEPFFSTWAGAGVGLYLARQIVLNEGGSISFTSISGCTRFVISLPVEGI